MFRVFAGKLGGILRLKNKGLRQAPQPSGTKNQDYLAARLASSIVEPRPTRTSSIVAGSGIAMSSKRLVPLAESLADSLKLNWD